MSISAEMAWLVQERAGRRCEYCRMRQALQATTFHVEHVEAGLTAHRIALP